jgi:F-box-like
MSSPKGQENNIVELPPETLLHIASYIDKPHDLISLAHTNSILRIHAVAKLYNRICLYRWSAKTIDVLDHLAR